MAEHAPTAAGPAADFEREKWRAEMALKERELALKEREGSLFKSPIVVSAIAVFVGLLSNAISDWITKDRRLAEETRQREAALLVKAFEHNDPNVVMANLTGMISDTNEVAKKLVGQEYTEVENRIKSLPSESLRQYQAALIQKAVEADDVDKVLRKLKLLDEANLIPDYDRVRRAYAALSTVNAFSAAQVASSAAVAPVSTAASTSPASTTAIGVTPTATAPRTTLAEPSPQAASCAAATRSSEGWIFLGGIDGNLQRWVVSDSGTRSIEFETAELNAGPDFKVEAQLTRAVMGQCLQTKTAKFMRGDGVDGRRLQSAVKQTLPAGTRLRVVGIDFAGRDDSTSARNPVLWARVEVLSD